MGERLEVRGLCRENDQQLEGAHCGEQVGSLSRCEKIRQMSTEQEAGTLRAFPTSSQGLLFLLMQWPPGEGGLWLPALEMYSLGKMSPG